MSGRVLKGTLVVFCSVASIALGWVGATLFTNGEGVELTPIESLTAAQAKAAATDVSSTVLPATAPPYLTTFQYVQADDDVRELRVQHQDFLVLVCAGPADVDTSCTQGKLLRQENVAGLEVRVVSLIPPEASEVDEHLGEDARQFVEGYWETVPLVTDEAPTWIQVAAQLGRV